MLFNSLTFVVFLAVVLALDRTLPSWRARKTSLLVASYLFYAAWNPPFVLLLWISTAIDWVAAKRIDRERLAGEAPVVAGAEPGRQSRHARLLQVRHLPARELRRAARDSRASTSRPRRPSIVLPVGISFYTFQTLSYTLDVYLRRARPPRLAARLRPLRHLLPAARRRARSSAPTDFLPQCEEPRRASAREIGLRALPRHLRPLREGRVSPTCCSPTTADRGLRLGARTGRTGSTPGSARSPSPRRSSATSPATRPAPSAPRSASATACPTTSASPTRPSGFARLLAALAHLALHLAARLPLHPARRQPRRARGAPAVNLMLTMLLGGLWHGAAWTFVVWGGLHGLYLRAERLARRALGRRRPGCAARRPPARSARSPTSSSASPGSSSAPRTSGGAGLLLAAMFGVIRGRRRGSSARCTSSSLGAAPRW